MDLAELLLVYGNWRGRFVKARPREVHISCELAAELANSPHETAVTQIAQDLATGVDLTPRLSTGVAVAYVPLAERKTGGGLDRDLDAVLAHDGLHHLHLGEDTGGRFVGRLDDLLFVAVRDDDAYLIGIYPHGSWARRDLLERMVRNWQKAELLAHLPGLRSRGPELSDEDRWKAVKGGVSVLIEIDGQVYMPPGQSTARTPIAVTQQVNAFMWELSLIREDGLRAWLAAHDGDPGLYWVPIVRDDHVGVESSQGFLAVGRLA